MNGLVSKTISNESSVINRDSNLVVNSLSTLLPITTTGIISSGTINNGSNSLTTGAITSTTLTNSGLITSGTIYAQGNFITIANGSSSHYFLTSGTSPTAGNFIGRLLGTSDHMYFDFYNYLEFRPSNTDGNIIGSSITFYNGGISSPSFSATNGSVSILNDTNSLATLYMNGFYIRKEATGGVGFVMNADNTYIWYSRASASILQLMTLDGGQLVVNVPINAGIKALTSGAITSSGNFSNGSNSLTTGAISCGTITSSGDVNIGGNTVRAGTVETGFIRCNYMNSPTGEVNGPMIIDPNYTTNNYVRVQDKLQVAGVSEFLGNMTSTGSFNNASNTITCGAITSSGNFSNGSNTMATGAIMATALTANTVNCASYGSQGGNLSIASPFTLNISTSNSCDTNFYTNRIYFNNNGGTIMTAINWGSTAQSGSFSMTVNGVIYAWGATMGSDDRIKGEEEFITGATATLLKLRPQTYNKYNDFSCSGDHIKESGLIAQDFWYEAPELRHIVTHSNDATIDPEEYIPSSTDPTNDPAEYSSWGSNPAGVSYTMLIPYLVKSIQELNQRIYDLEHP